MLDHIAHRSGRGVYLFHGSSLWSASSCAALEEEKRATTLYYIGPLEGRLFVLRAMLLAHISHLYFAFVVCFDPCHITHIDEHERDGHDKMTTLAGYYSQPDPIRAKEHQDTAAFLWEMADTSRHDKTLWRAWQKRASNHYKWASVYMGLEPVPMFGL